MPQTADTSMIALAFSAARSLARQAARQRIIMSPIVQLLKENEQTFDDALQALRRVEERALLARRIDDSAGALSDMIIRVGHEVRNDGFSRPSIYIGPRGMTGAMLPSEKVGEFAGMEIWRAQRARTGGDLG